MDGTIFAGGEFDRPCNDKQVGCIYTVHDFWIVAMRDFNRVFIRLRKFKGFPVKSPVSDDNESGLEMNIMPVYGTVIVLVVKQRAEEYIVSFFWNEVIWIVKRVVSFAVPFEGGLGGLAVDCHRAVPLHVAGRENAVEMTVRHMRHMDDGARVADDGAVPDVQPPVHGGARVCCRAGQGGRERQVHLPRVVGRRDIRPDARLVHGGGLAARRDGRRAREGRVGQVAPLDGDRVDLRDDDADGHAGRAAPGGDGLHAVGRRVHLHRVRGDGAGDVALPRGRAVGPRARRVRGRRHGDRVVQPAADRLVVAGRGRRRDDVPARQGADLHDGERRAALRGVAEDGAAVRPGVVDRMDARAVIVCEVGRVVPRLRGERVAFGHREGRVEDPSAEGRVLPRAVVQPGRAVEGVLADAGDAAVQVVVGAVLAVLPLEAVAAVALGVFVVGVEDEGLAAVDPHVHLVANGDQRGIRVGARRDGRLDDAVRRQVHAEEAEEERRQRPAREGAWDAGMGLFRHGVSLAASAAFWVFLIIALPPYGGNMFNITNVLINIGRLSVVNIIRCMGYKRAML